MGLNEPKGVLAPKSTITTLTATLLVLSGGCSPAEKAPESTLEEQQIREEVRNQVLARVDYNDPNYISFLFVNNPEANRVFKDAENFQKEIDNFIQSKSETQNNSIIAALDHIRNQSPPCPRNVDPGRITNEHLEDCRKLVTIKNMLAAEEARTPHAINNLNPETATELIEEEILPYYKKIMAAYPELASQLQTVIDQPLDQKSIEAAITKSKELSFTHAEIKLLREFLLLQYNIRMGAEIGQLL